MTAALTVGQSWLLVIAVLLTIAAFVAVVFAVADSISRRIHGDRHAKGQELEVMPAIERSFNVRTKEDPRGVGRRARDPRR